MAVDRLVLALLDTEENADELLEEWQLLPAPPEEVAELVDVTAPETVWVRGISGQLYSCSWVTEFDHACWVEQEAVSAHTWYEPSQVNPLYEGPDYPYPERVRASIAKINASRYPAAVKLVFLEDGTMRRWNHGGFFAFRAPRFMALFFAKFCGMPFVGLVVAIALAHRIVTRKVFGGKGENE